MNIVAKQKVLAETLGNIRTVEQLKRLLHETAEDFNIDKFAVTSVPPASGRKLSNYILYSNLNDNLISEYDELQMLKTSSHFQALRNSENPRIWRAEMQDHYVKSESTENMNRTREFLYKNQIKMGCSFPTSTTSGHSGIVMFMGDRSNLDGVSVAYLNFISSYAFNFIHERLLQKPDPTGMLTKRECEIVKLVADGLTSQAIANSLSITVHTVNSHLAQATKRLKCTNRINLVAKAFRLNLIG